MAAVLIVEDEAIVALDLSNQIQDLGHKVVGIADNADAAVRLATQHRPDVVLMDVVIKGDRDGIEAARPIQNELGIPVIFLTAFSDTQTVDRATQVGPFGYLNKPFQIRELRAAIQLAVYKGQMEAGLRESEQWFASALRCVGDGVVASDEDGSVRFMNPAAERITGWTLAEAVGKPVSQILCFASFDMEPSRPGNEPASREFGSVMVTRSGRTIRTDESSAPIHDRWGRELGRVTAFRDVSERIRTEQSLRESEQRFRSAFDHAPTGMALVALDGKLEQVNKAFCELLGYDARKLLSTTQERLSHPEDRSLERQHLHRLFGSGLSSIQFEKRYRRADGSTIWGLVSVSLLRQWERPWRYLYQVSDLTERRRVEAELARLAHQDSLTGLANRAGLSQEAERLITLAGRSRAPQQIGVIYMDLDRFKQVNDTLGHEVGDRLLQVVADRLRTSVREGDCVARLGGDEFVLLLPEVHGEADVAAIAEKLRQQVQQPIAFEDNALLVTTSMGVSLFPRDGGDLTTLLRCADSALYEAKAEGRDSVQMFHHDMLARLQERFAVERGLRGAAERGELSLHYQAVMSIGGEQPVAAEALLRWQHPERGLLSPAAFFDIAEDSGLSLGIGSWVVRRACQDAMAWPEIGGRALAVCVNLSSRQFRSSQLVGEVASALRESGLPPHRLWLEIGEKQLQVSSGQSLAVLTALKSLGVQIVIDDLGTGYSSLAYLKRFAPMTLKIDRSVVSGIVDDPDDAAIVRAVIGIARSLKVGVVAKGVETAAQRDLLESEGCAGGQGWLYAPTRSAADFSEWLRLH